MKHIACHLASSLLVLVLIALQPAIATAGAKKTRPTEVPATKSDHDIVGHFADIYTACRGVLRQQVRLLSVVPKEDDAKKDDAKKDDSKKDDGKEDEKSTPATSTVAKGPLKIEVTLDGVFEAQKIAEVLIRPEAWTGFKVLKAVEHGAEVEKGQSLVTLDFEGIDRAIADQRRSLKAAAIALKLADRELIVLTKTVPMDLEENRRYQKDMHVDYAYHLKTMRPALLRGAKFSLESAEQDVAYQREEVRQLENMYAADDLTEETEEIILTRARNDLKYVEFQLEISKLYYAETVDRDIPRYDISLKESVARGDIMAATTKLSLPLSLTRMEMRVAGMKRDFEKAKKKLNDLLTDRKAMAIKAPMSGIVYYGRSVRGKFTTPSAAATGYRRGAMLSANTPFMTIVKPRPVRIRVAVPERQLYLVKAGIKGTATPTAYPHVKLTSIVERVGIVPFTTGSFDGRITVAAANKAEGVMPGMSCKVKLIAYENKDAITIPPKALGTESDESKHFVHRVDKNGKSKKRSVTIGRRTKEKVEILKGLSVGDEVLAECPKS